MIQEIKKYFKTLEKEAIPQLSINCVIFSFHDQTLKVAVNKVSFTDTNIFVLPGGFVNQKENVSDAVERIVKESTGMEKILLRQFAVFGDAARSFGKEQSALLKKFGDFPKKNLEWISKRFVSICYMALVDANKIKLQPTQLLETAEWLPIEKIKILALDHSAMVVSARESLLKELPYSPIESNLLPSKFTLPELHKLLEVILGRTIDRPNFRRKILKSNLIVKVGKDDSGQRRPADVYTFKHGKKTSFNDALKYGF
jgi:8-oxo-dGTP diphosphatase